MEIKNDNNPAKAENSQNTESSPTVDTGLGGVSFGGNSADIAAAALEPANASFSPSLEQSFTVATSPASNMSVVSGISAEIEGRLGLTDLRDPEPGQADDSVSVTRSFRGSDLVSTSYGSQQLYDSDLDQDVAPLVEVGEPARISRGKVSLQASGDREIDHPLAQV